MEVIIDGIVYVPKETKTELDLLKEKYESGNYILVINHSGKWLILEKPEWSGETTKYKLIHTRHKDILDAWLEDNSVEIECIQDISSLCSNPTENVFKVDNFINEYKEYFDYKIKPDQQYPIFKRNEDGEVFKYHSNGNITCLLSTHNIGQVFTEYNSKVCKFNISGVETIPYDAKRCLYQLQPVWCWGNNWIGGRNIRFYSAETKKCIDVNNIKSAGSYDNIEPITPEQLKVVPFVWKMYQQVLKDKQ